MPQKRVVATGNVGLTPILSVQDDDLPATAVDGQVLAWDAATSTWKATSMAGTFISENHQFLAGGVTFDVPIPATAKHYTLSWRLHGAAAPGDMRWWQVAGADIGPSGDDNTQPIMGVLTAIVNACSLGATPTHVRLQNGAAAVPGNDIDFWVRFYT